MRKTNVVLLLLTLLASFGCGADKMADRRSASPNEVGERVSQGGQSQPARAAEVAASPEPSLYASGNTHVVFQQVALADAASAQAVTQATDRKIIRNAELAIETDTPKDAQARIASIAEANGGFVVTSEFKQGAAASSKPIESVTITIRVPSSQFSQTLDAIRAAGSQVIQEKVSGQDVTEEYIDLEARIRTQRALEAQFIEIMKQARKVSDALEVQSQLADVRTEIERLEGRRRFLDNRASLSTITVTLQTAAPLVVATTSGFNKDIKDAFGDGVDTAVAIVLGVIRVAIVLTPVLFLIVLPLWFVLRRMMRRYSWLNNHGPAVTSAE